MKIVLFAHSFPPVIGGAQTYQYYLASYLTKFGHQVLVVTGDLPEGYQDADFTKEGFDLLRLSGFREVAKLKIPFKEFLPSAYQAISQFEPDVIHSHGYTPGLIVSMLQSRLTAKHIFSYHATPIPEEQKLSGIFSDFAVEQAFTEFIFQHCPYDLYIANSQYYLNSSLSRGIPESKAKLIYYGIDLKKFSENVQGDRSKWGFNNNDYVISCPIRLIERKGIFDILESLYLLKDSHIKLFIPTSRLYTPKGLEEAVNNKIQQLGLNSQIKIVFDQISHFDMPEVYAMSDLMVLPSHIEGLGIVLLEALATKTPVVATAAQGISEIIRDQETGLLAEVKNPQDLANKIFQAMSHSELMKTYTENGYQYVHQNFDIEPQIKKVEEVYKLLTGK